MTPKYEIGFYSVNGKKYSNKLDAVLAAQKINAPVQWNFFDDVFEKTNWQQEPDLTLDQLYKIRAEQIRAAYDYVIVFCSGGADSNNVIRTFLNNNIRVDEVIGLAPMSGLGNWQFDASNLSESNTISESKFALLPLLDEISKKGIKTTLYDFFEDIIKYKDEQWTMDACGNIVTALTSHFTNVDKIPHISKIIESGKRVGLVYGTDKPVIKIDTEGNLVSVLSDIGVNYLNMPESRSYPNVDRVLFYWTHELPELMVKQAHLVYKAMRLPQYKDIYDNEIVITPQSLMGSVLPFEARLKQQQLNLTTSKAEIFKKHTENKYQYIKENEYNSYKTIYQRSIVPFIYPTTYSKNLFQAQKIDTHEGFFTRDQDWLHVLHGKTRISEMIMSGTRQLHASISPRYLNYHGTGFAIINKTYKFGHVKTYDYLK